MASLCGISPVFRTTAAKFLLKSRNQSLADRVQDVDEIARAPDLSHQRHLRKHVHFLRADVQNSPQLVVAPKFVPRRIRFAASRRMEQFLGLWIGEEEKFAPLEAERVCQT